MASENGGSGIGGLLGPIGTLISPPETYRPPGPKYSKTLRQRMKGIMPTAPSSATPPSLPGSLMFNPIPPIQRGAQRGTAILREISEWLQLYRLLEALIKGKAPVSPYPQYPQPGPVYYPAPQPTTVYPRPQPVYSTPQPTTGVYSPTTQGGPSMAYSFGFMPTGAEYGTGSMLGDLGQLALGVGSIVRSFKEPTYGQPQKGFFDIPGVDIQSPIRLETPASCQALQTPWRMPTTTTSARPQMHVLPNPVTGKLTFFAPVRITGVKPYNTGIRRKRSCCRTTRRRKR